MNLATLEAIEVSRREAVEARVAAFRHDLASVAPHRAGYLHRLVAVATLVAAHRRQASTALPEDLLAAYDLSLELLCREQSV